MEKLRSTSHDVTRVYLNASSSDRLNLSIDSVFPVSPSSRTTCFSRRIGNASQIVVFNSIGVRIVGMVAGHAVSSCNQTQMHVAKIEHDIYKCYNFRPKYIYPIIRINEMP